MTTLLRLPTTPLPPETGVPTIQVDQVIEGDLVFCARPGFLQQLCHRADEPWRHVGLVAEIDGEPCICEVAGGRFAHRPLASLPPLYDAVAIARFHPRYRDEARQAAQWSATFADRPQVYAWDDLILAGMIAVTRCYIRPDEEEVLSRSLAAALSAMRPTPPEPDAVSFTCASFIAEALHSFGIPLEIDLTASRCPGQRPSLLELVRSRYRPLRSAAGSRINREQLVSLTKALTLGVVAATTGLTACDQAVDHRRWATPGDLWRSAAVVHRWYLDGVVCQPATETIK